MLEERHGLLVRLEGEAGAVGWGEAAPLPGFSVERLNDAVEEFRQIAEALAGIEVPGTSLSVPEGLIRPDELSPSVLFGVESALVELRAAARATSVPRLLGGGAPTVSVNALIGAEQQDLENTARSLEAKGYRAVKLKVGRASIDADVQRVRTVRRALGSEVQLRLDANRAWSYADARFFAEQIEDLSVDYVEEPLADPSELPRFTEETALPVAIDETTRESAPADLAERGRIAAVVLKPTLLGGVIRVREWVESARAEGATPVFSAAYESGVGLRMIVALSSVFSTVPAGVSTYEQLKTDVLVPRLSLPGPVVEVAPLWESSVERSHLERLDSYE